MTPGFSPQAPLSPEFVGQRAGTQLGGRRQGSHGALLHLQENLTTVGMPAWWSSPRPCLRTRFSSFQGKYALAFGERIFSSNGSIFSLLPRILLFLSSP